MSNSVYHILVVAPSGLADKTKVEAAIELLKSNGHTVEVGRHIYETEGPFAGTDAHRLEDLQWALDSVDADIIWMARGGYGLTRIIDFVDLSKFAKRPKLIIGFSDITALFLDKRFEPFAVCHGPMMQNLNQIQLDTLEQILVQKSQNVICVSNSGKVDIDSVITGGNLSLIVNQMGILDNDFYNGKTLLIEEIAEYGYKIDRMLIQLIRSGIISRLSAILLGDFTDTEQGRYPLTDYTQAIIGEADKYSIPVFQNLPVGHIDNNTPLLFNTKANLQYSESALRIEYHNQRLFDS